MQANDLFSENEIKKKKKTAVNVGLSFIMSLRTNEDYFITTLNRYSLFLKEILLLLPVRLYSVLWQKLHEFQRLFDFYQNLINFTAFDL